MSELQFEAKDGGIVKPAREADLATEAAPAADAGTVLQVPAGKGQTNIRAKAITQLQRSHGNRFVRRAVARSVEERTPDELARAVDSQRGGGQALPTKTQSKMENALDTDLSGVRIHSNAASDELSRDFGARAFTTGQDIFFRSGAYDPGSAAGEKLVAHELTHVVQQGNEPARLTGREMSVSEPGDAGEREADQISSSVRSDAASTHQDQGTSSDEERVQMQPAEEEEIQPQVEEEEIQPQVEEEEIQPQVEEEEIQPQVEEEEIQPQVEEEVEQF